MNDQQAVPRTTPDLYETLQVSPNADAEVIEAAYRVLARRYHPDLNESPDATAMMAQINGAWEALRDPERRAAYDRTLQSASPNVMTAPPPAHGAASATATQEGTANPLLVVEPAAISLGALRHGTRRSVAVGIYTEPPGIRVQVRVSAGSSWLAVSPAVLQGIDQARIDIDVRTTPLRPGIHRGTVEVSTSWETRRLRVDVDVRPARMLFRIAAFARNGPHGSGWRSGTIAATLAVLLLLAIVAGLAVLAIGR